MKNRLKIILILISVMVASCLLASCTGTDKIQEYGKQGYTVKVTFDGNGGTFVGKIGNQVIDLYKPENYALDENNTAHIKLTDPTERILQSTGEQIMLTMSGYSNVGWYKKRELVTNENGEPIDENGNVLVLQGDRYYIKDTLSQEAQSSDSSSASTDASNSAEEDVVGVESFPQYNYSEPFDFAADTIDAKPGEMIDITLYAGWLKHYEFNYYYVNNGEKKLIQTQTFDYKVVNAENSRVSDKDTIWLPKYVDGAMNYTYNYSNREIFTFPSVENTTFDKAYLDENLTQEITTAAFEHQGTFDKETCKAINRVQNIYFTTVPGMIYKIYKATDFTNNPNLDGIYEIYADLDFTGLTWPNAFTQGTFNGEIKSMAGSQVKFSNINATFASGSSTTAGVFGALSNTADVEDIAFENIKLTVSSVPTRISNFTLGTLFGNVDESAKVSNISLTNATLVLQYVAIDTTDEVANNQVNLLANGKTQGITATDTIHLHISGRKVGSTYRYQLDPTATTIDAEGKISLKVDISFKDTEKQIYEIQ